MEDARAKIYLGEIDLPGWFEFALLGFVSASKAPFPKWVQRTK